MTENIMENGYQILIVNIKYGKELSGKNKNKPTMTVLDVPDNILRCINNETKFKDAIETFAYNTLTKKYNSEVNFCQIWLPFN